MSVLKSAETLQTQAQPDSFRTRLTAIGLSMLVGTALMGAKFYAYYRTGSAAILSDALESIINVVASGFAVFSIVMAARPPDESHPYGHGKIEFFSAGFEGALIIFAALGIFRSGLGHILHPRGLPHLGEGLLILLGTAAVNLLLGIVLLRTGKRTDSITLIADGRHVLTDVFTSAAVVGGLLLVAATGWYRLDGIVACLVGVQILRTGYDLLRQAYAGLMHESDSRLLAEVSELLAAHRRERWIDIHQLRAWKSGNHTHIDLHVVLPRDLDLYHAHEEALQLEKVLLRHFEQNASILVHMDPCAAPDCPACRKARCDMRGSKPDAAAAWDAAGLTAPGRHRAAVPDGNRDETE